MGMFTRRYMVKQTDFVCTPLPYISARFAARFMHRCRHFHRQNKINDGGNRVRTCFFFFFFSGTQNRMSFHLNARTIVFSSSNHLSCLSHLFISFFRPRLYHLHLIQPCRQSSPEPSNCWDKLPNTSHLGLLPSLPP